MEDVSGSKDAPAKGPPSTSLSPSGHKLLDRRPCKILIAEDNAPDVFLLREALRTQGLPCEIQVIDDGAEVIRYIAESEDSASGFRPDILVLDLNLPKRDGFEVLRWLRSGDRYHGIPVLIVTSSDAPGDRLQAQELGATYFRKPADYKQFLKVGEILRTLLGR